MSEEEKLTWLLEWHYERRVQQEIDRIFQRFYHFLVGSSFLLSGFGVLVAQMQRHCGQLQASVIWILIVTGTLLSFGFWGINSWNSEIVSRYESWMKQTGGSWLWGRSAREPFAKRHANLSDGFEEDCLKLGGDFWWGGLLRDLFHPRKPAWFARVIPFLFFLVWIALGCACWKTVWLVCASLRGLVIVIGVVLVISLLVGLLMSLACTGRNQVDGTWVESVDHHAGTGSQQEHTEAGVCAPTTDQEESQVE